MTLAHLRPALAEEAGITGPGLWQCYEMLASDIANTNQLLVGSFDEWLALIDSGLTTPGATRALFAFLVLNGSQAIREIAEPRLIEALRAEPQGARVLHTLYLSSSPADEQAVVPETVRYPLIELALDDGRLALARELADGLDRSPLIAKLVLARILLHQYPDEGATTIRSLLANTETPSPEEVDGFRVAVNELGGVLPEDEVLGLLEELRKRAGPAVDTGEILMSIAAIEMRQLEFQRSAISYLKASRATNDSSTERQALTQAARALSLGRMNEQARELYRQLLAKPLPDDERRQISRELEGPRDLPVTHPVDQTHIDAFLDALWMERGLAQNTLSAYRADLQKFCRWLERRDRRLVECRREDVLDFLVSLATSPPRSAARRLSKLTAFLPASAAGRHTRARPLRKSREPTSRSRFTHLVDRA